MISTPVKTYTPEEYLEFETASTTRNETISSFQEYLLIDQVKPHVERYIKQSEHQWLFIEYDNLEDRFMLSSIGVEICLADLYENIEF
ncbi:hypothetical protein VB774_08255 [Pseudanabaena galeata UHCC 0370]|uniref:Restriction endonuclease domain-containing protein n=1 Tax=Pseudanabaena galeata UHCC 0370 TaxID=3110310 RepID=A0ABU5TH63_9CYAN|nr:hypothetical protein [Pseudanabaena galeata]MEA5477611.1 hypothetical protein [Pseudanabaena galeata UHCC 0370]